MTVRISELPNGIRVVSDEMPQLETASVGVWFDVGARYESEEQNGVSHLLEHMAFKGTKRRTARGLAEEIEAVGGHLNAYTTCDHTTYYTRVMKEDVGLSVDILADILQNSLFDVTELQREKDVILQEIGQANDTPDDIVFDMLQATAFPEQPLGRSILGTAARVRNFNRDIVSHYMRDHYRGDGTILAAAGNISHDALVDMTADAFASFEKECNYSFEAASYGGGESRMARDLEQLHITLGFPGLSYEDPDYYALQVFSAICGGGMSSRLFQEVREERGLAYSVYSFSASHADTGLFGIYAGTSPELAGELLPVVADQMKGLAESVDEVEVARARARLKAGLLMSLESTTSRIEQLSRQMLIFGRPIPTTELIEKVDAIDAAAVERVAHRILQGGLAMAAVGPVHSLPELSKVEALFR